MPEEIKLSVSIITFNEEKNIERTLKAVEGIADEIVIVDSGSTDQTVQIANNHGARVFIEEWKGFARQKNFALEKCSGEWILMLDADEQITPELADEISDVMKDPAADAYLINRKTFYIGKLMNYAWQPDWNLRLSKRSASPVWKGEAAHEYLSINGSAKKLKGNIIHYSYSGIRHHFEKTISYAEISAKGYYNKGKRAGVINILLNPFYAFLRLYFIRLGFLDGLRGFIAAISSAFGTFLKYAFLWEIDRKEK